MTTTEDTYGYATNSFEPGTVTIRVGGTVTWSYHGTVMHNATFSPGTGVPANVPNGRGGSVSRTFNTEGDFDYICTNHSGMIGIVQVRGG
jgi:plastocyanin